jgi:MoaA/NifB/PqqE/SkfB family radical SAM enzyme
MTEDIFRASLEMDDEVINIGGGEPTLHPKFWKFLTILLARRDTECIWLATNGSRTEDALALAKLAKSGAIGVDLSRDKFHSPIDPKVVTAFAEAGNARYESTNHKDYNDLRHIRSVTEVIRAGRGKDIGNSDACPCSDTVVRPDGNIRW